MPEEFLLNHISGSFVEMVQWWVRRDMKETPEELDAYFRAVIEPTVPLSRKIFEAPTQYYKAGVVFLAWLNGHQDHFTMPAGMQSARGVLHYADVFRLADQANVLDKPELASARMKSLMTVLGVD